MKRRTKWILTLIAIVFASGILPGAEQSCAEESILTLYDAQTEIDVGDLVRLTLSDNEELQAQYCFTPSTNGDYDVYLFPVTSDLDAQAELWQGDTLIASGSGKMQVLTCRLTSGTEYVLKLSGEGSAILEIAWDTLSRCFDMPLELDDGSSYSKSITRAGDVHWYAVTAETDGAAIFAAAPQSEGLRLRMWLFDENGTQLGTYENLASGAAVMSAELQAGETYYVRVAGALNKTGKYSLQVLRGSNTTRADSVLLSSDALEIAGRSTELLEIQLQPEGCSSLIYLDSSNESVVTVTEDGYAEGGESGTATVTVYAYGGARSSCRVTVTYVGVESVSLSVDEMSLSAGSEQALNVTLSPVNATDRTLSYQVEDETIATVDENGVVSALQEGVTQVSVVSEDGAFSDTLTLTVTAAERSYRALLIGEQNYASTVESTREGSVKSVESLMSLLKTASFDGEGYSVSMLMDVSRDNVIAGIREAFADAKEEDVSLVYITCHGYYQAGMTFFLMTDGSVLSAAELAQELRQIPGEIILIADCCGSGGLIGESSSTEDLLEGITSVFEGTLGSASVHGSKFKVLASAYLDQDSYRIGFGSDGTESMSTVFARALCDAMGWSMDRSAQSAMNADANYDGEITLTELGSYVEQRVAWYLNLSGDYVQSVSWYPGEDATVLFARAVETIDTDEE